MIGRGRLIGGVLLLVNRVGSDVVDGLGGFFELILITSRSSVVCSAWNSRSMRANRLLSPDILWSLGMNMLLSSVQHEGVWRCGWTRSASFILKNGASFPRCCCIVLVHDADSHGCFALVGWLMLSETVNEGNRRFCQRKQVCSVCRPSPWISHRLVRVVFRAASLSCRHLSESSHPVKYILL